MYVTGTESTSRKVRIDFTKTVPGRIRVTNEKNVFAMGTRHGVSELKRDQRSTHRANIIHCHVHHSPKLQDGGVPRLARQYSHPNHVTRTPGQNTRTAGCPGMEDTRMDRQLPIYIGSCPSGYPSKAARNQQREMKQSARRWVVGTDRPRRGGSVPTTHRHTTNELYGVPLEQCLRASMSQSVYHWLKRTRCPFREIGEIPTWSGRSSCHRLPFSAPVTTKSSVCPQPKSERGMAPSMYLGLKWASHRRFQLTSCPSSRFGVCSSHSVAASVHLHSLE